MYHPVLLLNNIKNRLNNLDTCSKKIRQRNSYISLLIKNNISCQIVSNTSLLFPPIQKCYTFCSIPLSSLPCKIFLKSYPLKNLLKILIPFSSSSLKPCQLDILSYYSQSNQPARFSW